MAESDRGAVTVEAAIALCALVTVFGLLLGGVAAVADQIRCTDAAREAARLLSRGDRQRAESSVRAIAPDAARLTVHREGDVVRVEVSAEPLGGALPGVHLRGEALAVLEPGVGEADASG